MNGGSGTWYIYNNTVFDSKSGIVRSTEGTLIAKNNIYHSNGISGGDGYGSSVWGSGSDYNISNVTSDTTDGVHDKQATVSFSDSANSDFHLSPTDTAARGNGTSTASDTNLAVTSDIDGHSRPATVVDIGADQSANAVYYSVGQSSSDLKTGSPNITISNGTSTFTVAQTGNIGVGDVIDYDTDNKKAYISAKINTSNWRVITATGTVPADISGKTVNSIKRAFTSLSNAVISASSSPYLNTLNLYSSNVSLNFPCYYDSGSDTSRTVLENWTTTVPNYIKIYTPFNTATESNNSQRHQGKWTSTAYTIARPNMQGIYISNNYIKIDGIQFDNSASANQAVAIYNKYSEISNCIIRNATVGLSFSNSTDYAKVYNNLIYGVADKAIAFTNTSIGYFYNNTLVNNPTAFYKGCVSASTIVTNNIFSGNTNDYVNGACSTDPTFSYNSTNQASGIPAGTGNRYSQAFAFIDATNNDYHLSLYDTGAKNYGTDLSATSTLAFSSDLDGNTRPPASAGSYGAALWDIGADEAASPIYYSVGQDGTTDRKVAATVTIATSGLATFSAAQTGNIGVGDVVLYGTPTTTAYIASKQDTSNWYIQTATGTIPTATTSATLLSIKRAYSSLSTAVTGASDSSHLSTSDLFTPNYQLNFPCYYDTGPDTTAVTVSGYMTYPTNYLKIYTPTSTVMEANNSQRHSGKWDGSKYILSGANNQYTLSITSSFVKIDGLQISVSVTTDYVYAVYNYAGNGSEIQVSNNIIKGIYGGNADGGKAYYGQNISSGNKTSKIWNNIIYDFTNGTKTNFGGIIFGGYNTAFIYNTTIINSPYGFGIYPNWQNVVAKNVITQNCEDGYSGTFTSGSDYNISDLSGDTTGGAHDKQATVNFVDKNNYDFHLAETDTAAREMGADLSNDTGIPASAGMTADIDGNTRFASTTGRSWDIGADEGSTYVYYSVGQNTSDHKTGAPTVTIASGTATFSVAQTATNMGVGDEVTYNTNSKAYISKKIDTATWKLITATGTMPANISGATVNQIAHAFNSLGGASGALRSAAAGAKDSSHLNTSNLYAGNYILNIPCYYDTGADTAAVTVSNWTTANNNYIKIYTPNDILTETNQVQRHSGKWSNSKYRMELLSTMNFNSDFIKIDGLQIKSSASIGTIRSFYIDYQTRGNNKIEISNNIISGVNTGSAAISGILRGSDSDNIYIWNNILYGLSDYAIKVIGGIGYIYNNSIANNNYGIMNQGTIISKNNLSYNNNTDYYNNAGLNPFNSLSANNITNKTPSQGAFGVSADSGITTSAVSGKLIQSGKKFTKTVKLGMIVKDSGSNYSYVTSIDSDTQISLNDNIMGSSEAYTIYTNRFRTASFINHSGKDYHLSPSDTAARNAGVKLAAYSDDPYLFFNTDIDGQYRGATWSIGADDGAYVQVQSYENTSPANAPTLDINSGLVLYQSFNGQDIDWTNISAEARDRSGQNNHGDIVGAKTVAGKKGQGLKFDGSSSYVSIATPAEFSTSTGAMSVWVKPNFAYNVASNQPIFTMYSNDINRWSLYYTSTLDGWKFYHIGGGNEASVGSDVQTFATGTWIHILVTWNSGGTNMYTNGTYKNNNPTSLALTPASLRIGMDQYGSDSYFNGTIDEVRIYNRALSDKEIGMLYRMGQTTIKKGAGSAVIKK